MSDRLSVKSARDSLRSDAQLSKDIADARYWIGNPAGLSEVAQQNLANAISPLIDKARTTGFDHGVSSSMEDAIHAILDARDDARIKINECSWDGNLDEKVKWEHHYEGLDEAIAILRSFQKGS